MLSTRDLWKPVSGVRRRASSWDRTGGNKDTLPIEPGGDGVLLDVNRQSGVITRIWFTINTDEPDYLVMTRIRCSFDGETTVDCPVGMFAATGPWRVNDLVSATTAVMRCRPGNRDDPGAGRGSFNMLWSMPYRREARIEMLNLSGVPLSVHYHVDYFEEEVDETPLLFHATHKEPVITGPAVKDSSAATNLSDRRNYQFIEIEKHEGRYVGTVLAVESHPSRAGKWYEGDDMFFVDGERWPPSVHGTGTEDYFGLAWGVHRPYQSLDCGVGHYERGVAPKERFYDGRFVMYRWHLVDPIVFRQSLRASIEAGHANDSRQHYESVAFWYGRRRGFAAR